MGNKFYSNWKKDKLINSHSNHTLKYIKEIEPKSTILDVGGFGTGGLNTTVYLKQKGCSIDVLNIDDSVKGWCNDFDVHFIHADIFNYSNKEKKYDVIVMELVIEKQIDVYKENLIDKLKDILKPNGYILTFYVDDISNVPTKRLKETKHLIEEFKKDYLNNIPIEEIYKEEFIGVDSNRKYMKWFKFPK